MGFIIKVVIAFCIGAGAIARRIDLQHRAAQNAVPVRRSFPGVPRY